MLSSVYRYKLHNNTRVRVSLGHQLINNLYKEYEQWINSSEQIVIHPKYVESIELSLNESRPKSSYTPEEKILQYHDLAIVKLNGALNLTSESIVQSICLVDRNYSTKVGQYVMSAGWGRVPEQTMPVQMGTRITVASPLPAGHLADNMGIFDKSIHNQSLICGVSDRFYKFTDNAFTI